ncbi:MAG: ABC transporter substrate-binding protein [Burkholderiaceae bacterium]|nr:ABC transporter substrate-binding protein [Burkholderiaceae bacterium]
MSLRSVWRALALGAALLPFCVAVSAQMQARTVRLLLEPQPPTALVLTTTAGGSLTLSPKTNEGLLAFSPKLEPQPQLATEWAISPDGLRYTFKLRQGVKWHDGQPFSSADVRYSIRTLKEVHPRGRSTFANVERIDTPDAHTAVIHLSKPAPYLLYALAASESPIVARHLFEGKDVHANPQLTAPTGTGPWIFKEWVRGSHIIYDRNPDYWGKPKPAVERLVIRFFPDAAARAAALETGEVDIASGSTVALTELKRLTAKPDLALEEQGWQYTNNVTRLEFNLSNPYLKHQKVRQAIAHALDKQAIINVVQFGYGKTANGPISPDLERFYLKELPDYAFDLKKAGQLLDEAGFARGANGQRFSLTADYWPNSNLYRRTAEFIRPALARVGIAVTVRSQDAPAYLKRVYTDRDFDFTVNPMSNLFDPTVGVQRLYWSKNIKKGLPFSNGSGYSNPQVDHLFEAAAIEPDEKKRKALFDEVQRIIVRDLPDITLFVPYNFTIYNKKVAGHTVTADGTDGNFADIEIKP